MAKARGFRRQDFDKSGVPMHDVVVAPVGTYCSYTEEKNPDCSKCRAFITQQQRIKHSSFRVLFIFFSHAKFLKFHTRN